MEVEYKLENLVIYEEEIKVVVVYSYTKFLVYEDNNPEKATSK